ncbi:VWA domain-containing protein [Salinifilum aidingensis]
MESTVVRFARLLRMRGVRLSVSEVLDALRGLCAPGVLEERALFREALRSALIKDQRDDPVFDELFAALFAADPVAAADEPAAEDEPAAGAALEDFTLGDVEQRPPRADMESPDAEVGDLFDEDDLIERYSPHPELNPISMSSDSSDELMLSQDDVAGIDNSDHVQLETDRMGGTPPPGELSSANAQRIDADLTDEQQDALLGWLSPLSDPTAAEDDGDADDAAALRRRLSGLLQHLPEALEQHIARLLAAGHDAEEAGDPAVLDRIDRSEREELEDSLNQLAQSLRGGLTSRRVISSRGRVDSARTMRRNMRFDGVPFRPIAVRRTEDKPRLVVLADVSLSVRATARFTLHLVHGLQNRFRKVRSFAFVAEVAEVTSLFSTRPSEHALGLIFDGRTLDVDADSDCGKVFGDFLEEYRGALDRSTTVVVLGDGRNNGRPPNLPALEEISRACRELIWLTPEPRHSWALGGCDLPHYAENCDRVQVVRDLTGLRRTAERMAEEVTGR